MKITEKDRERMRRAARAELAKRGVMSFRMNQNDLYALLQLACDRRVLAGPMVRDWVVERLRQETDPNPPGPSRLDALEKRVKQIEDMVTFSIPSGKRSSRAASAQQKSSASTQQRVSAVVQRRTTSSTQRRAAAR